MPYEKDVQERKTWWCPKWYWPFAVCSGIRTQHKWCYNFAWVKETRYGFIGHLEGCENGRLFTWTRAVVGLGSSTYAGGEMCFDSSRGSDEGRCDPSRTGLQASGLSASDPFASDIDYDVLSLRSTVSETGTFDFSGENERLCQKGLWPWRRTLHEQVIIASVATRFVQIQWYIGGTQISGNSGNILLGSLCRWPFPLPNGRSENRSARVRYEVVTEANKSTLKLYNDPADGSYSLSIAMSAVENGNEYASSYTSASFQGETCDFAAEQVQELAKCIGRFRDRRNEKAKFRRPTPGEPVIVFSEEIWKFVREENRDIVNSLMEIISSTFRDDPESFKQAIDQLEQQIGLAGISRFISVGSSESGHAGKIGGQANGLGRQQPVAVVLIAVGIGLLGLVIGRLTAGSRNRL